jgi:hypothetical protein
MRGRSSQVLKILSVLSLLAVSSAGAQGNPPTPSQPELKLAFETNAVVATGVPPGGQVVWFAVAREIAERSATLVRRERIAADDDKDGAVRFELGRPVPLQSIWVAVDLASGAAAVATPEGYPLRRIELPGRGTGHGGGKPDWVEDDRGFVEILLVRPGQGAWGATVGDGGEADEDGAYDGRLMAPLDRMRGVGEAAPPPPEHFSPRDVVVVIDPNRMEVGLRQLVEVQP